MLKKPLILVNIIPLFLSVNIFANEAIEDDLGGFGEEITTLDEAPVKTVESAVKLSGDLAFKTSAGYKQHKVDGIEFILSSRPTQRRSSSTCSLLLAPLPPAIRKGRATLSTADI